MKRTLNMLILILICCGCTEDTTDPTDPTEVSDPTETPDPTDTPTPTKTIKVATYNMGLATGYVPYAAERRDQVTAAVANSDADIICLTEVWFDDNIEYVSNALTETYPHQYSHIEPVEVGTEAACTEEDGAPLMACAIANECPSATDLGQCVLTNCLDEYNALPPNCGQCLAANLGLGDIEAIFVACTTGSTEWLYDGHNGLMLMSKQPMENKKYMGLNTWLIVRAALYAEIDGVQILCTHLASDVGVEYGGDFDSLDGEHKDQVDSLISEMNTNNLEGPQIISGDLNAGPLVGNLASERPDNYRALTDDGYADANCSADEPFCTWCADNLITNDPVNSAIDHVMVRQATTANPVRLFDETINIESAEDGTVEVHMSDHFGLQVDVTWDQ